MATNDLTARDIESPPAAEPGYLLSARIYDSATNAPDQFQALVTQLDQDAKTGAAPGVKIDYDNQGKVAAITLNNEKLYDSTDTSIPGQLAQEQLGSDIGSGDMNAALTDANTIATVFGVTDIAGLKQAVLDNMGQGLGSLLQSDQATAGQYLAALMQSGASDPADLQAVLQKAKDTSGLGDRLAIETDPQSGAVTAFKIDGQDLLAQAPAGSDVADAQPTAGSDPNALASASNQPANLFSPPGNDVPAAAAPDQGDPQAQDYPAPGYGSTPVVPASYNPDTDAAPVVPANYSSAGDGSLASATAAAPSVASASDAPLTNNSGYPAGAATPTDGPAAAATPAAGALDATRAGDHQGWERRHFEKLLERSMDHHEFNPWMHRREAFHHREERFHRDWREEDCRRDGHHMDGFDHGRGGGEGADSQRDAGRRDRSQEIQQRLAAFDQASPDQRRQMFSQVRREAEEGHHQRYSPRSGEGQTPNRSDGADTNSLS